MVLGCRAEHGRTSNVNIFDALFKGGALVYSVLKRIEIENSHVNVLDIEFFHFLFMLRIASYSQETSMNFWVKCLDASVQTFRRLSVIGNIQDVESCLTKCFGSAACGKEVDVLGGEKGGKFDNTSLVRDGNESTSNGNHVRVATCMGRVDVGGVSR